MGSWPAWRGLVGLSETAGGRTATREQVGEGGGGKQERRKGKEERERKREEEGNKEGGRREEGARAERGERAARGGRQSESRERKSEREREGSVVGTEEVPVRPR